MKPDIVLDKQRPAEFNYAAHVEERLNAVVEAESSPSRRRQRSSERMAARLHAPSGSGRAIARAARQPAQHGGDIGRAVGIHSDQRGMWQDAMVRIGHCAQGDEGNAAIPRIARGAMGFHVHGERAGLPVQTRLEVAAADHFVDAGERADMRARHALEMTEPARIGVKDVVARDDFVRQDDVAGLAAGSDAAGDSELITASIGPARPSNS